MRSATTAQAAALSGKYYTVGLQVWVADGDGTLQNYGSRGGVNYVDGVTRDRDIDQNVAQLTVALRREAGATLSLSPLRSDSTLNRKADTTFAPAIDVGRLIVVKVATVAANTAIVSGDYVEIFRGYIDTVNWEKSQMSLVCRDLIGVYADRFIEVSAVYGSVSGTAIESVMQTMISSYGGGGTLNVPASPSFLVTPYTQEIESVADALTALVGMIGWYYCLLWDGTSGTWKPTLLNPNRTKTTPDLTIGPDRYISVTDLKIDQSQIRNAVDVIYTDKVSGAVTTLALSDSASIAKYGRRWMRFQEAANSPINTHTEAVDMGNAALSDLKDPKADQEIEMHFDWRIEINDLLQWSANSVHYNAAQKLAVAHVTDRLQVTSGGSIECRTTVQTRGAPAGAYGNWIDRGGTGGVDPTDPTSPVSSLPVIPQITQNQVDSTTSPVTVSVSARNLPGVYSWAVYPGDSQGNYGGTPVISGNYGSNPLSATPLTFSVVPALKYDKPYMLEILVGFTPYREYVNVFGRLLFVDSSGAPVRGTAWSDGGGAATTSDPAGNSLSSGVGTSTGAPVNKMYAKPLPSSPDTADSISNGSTNRVPTNNEATGGGRGFVGLNSSNVLVTGVASTATVAGSSAATVASGACSSLFRETFDTDPVANGRWSLTGAAIAMATQSGIVGPNALASAGVSNLTYSQLIPYNAGKLHRIRARIRQYADGGTQGVFYVGVIGYLATGLVANNNSGAVYVCVGAASLHAADGWVEYTGFFMGATVSYTSADTASTDASAPAALNTNTVAISPYVLLNNSTGNGTQLVDYIEIDVFDEDASFRTYTVIGADTNLTEGTLATNGTTARQIASGKIRQTGLVNTGTVSFAGSVPHAPVVVVTGGVSYEPGSVWGSPSDADGSGGHGSGTSAPLTSRQVDEVYAYNVSLSGCQIRARLRQVGGTVTHVTNSTWSPTSTSAVGTGSVVTLATGPSYDDNYTASFGYNFLRGVSQAHATSLAVVVSLDYYNGSSWVSTTTATFSASDPGFLTGGAGFCQVTGSFGVVGAVAGRVSGDQLRLVIQSATATGGGTTSLSLTPTSLDYYTASADQYASKTPSGITCTVDISGAS